VGTFWEAYGFLNEVNASNGCLFPLALGVQRECGLVGDSQSSLLFILECPDAISLNSLLGSSLAKALRNNGDIVAVWCKQLAEARSYMMQSKCYQLHSPTLEDVFVRENGTLIMGNVHVSSRNSMSSNGITGDSCVRDYDKDFSKFMCSLLAAVLDTSRLAVVDIGRATQLTPIDAQTHFETGHESDIAVFDFTVAEGSILTVVMEGCRDATSVGSGSEVSSESTQNCRVSLLHSLISSKEMGAVHPPLQYEDMEVSASFDSVNYRREGDFVLTCSVSDSAVASPRLRPSCPSRRSDRKPIRSDRHNSCVVEGGKIHLELTGRAAGVATYTLSKIGRDSSATAKAILRVSIVSYPVSSNADVEELICLLDRSDCSRPLSEDFVCRVLGCKMLTNNVRLSYIIAAVLFPRVVKNMIGICSQSINIIYYNIIYLL
jgi:hypothetical protein